MFSLFKSKAVIVGLVLASVFAFAVLRQLQLETAEAKLEVFRGQQAALNLDLDRLRQTVSEQEDERVKWVNERDLIAAINAQYEREQVQISAQLQAKYRELNELMEKSHEIQNWGDIPVPNDVIELLKRPACANRDRNENRICVAAQ
ncbi:hypothetical protein [Shewanella surugensis]|uniref:DUF2570 domain-containing protein n=1 Tax=Shewanella surugensis TaxID=212020 RepID=A0ABT0L6V4_9GAMM|nr:hypothetical protein [Shewanella surugensis]MCL1123403.1 hypothetical protein [Shewanella surugensis]